MKKPYVKKICDIAGFHVWYVNGYWIRKHFGREGKEFTNYGQNYKFKFIPKNEFWIDVEAGKRKEINYYLNSMLLMEHLLEEGVSHKKAVKIASKMEKAERLKLKSVQKLEEEKQNQEKIIKRVHKRFLKKLSREIQVWIVRGDLVRSLFFVDFTQGGHDKVYDFIPKGEVWIDDDVYYKEIPFILIHELHERYLVMKDKTSKNMKEAYEKAHVKANELEYYCRHHPKEIGKILRREIKRNRVE